ncbi:MAG TPA: site-2 protease family protein [Polyangiaceae bacterium]|jgi:membrane-associated protease RseP (regulator of RpoE activity)|nr:site-2 protease family protein [Polyangiaceae bacterium]
MANPSVPAPPDRSVEADDAFDDDDAPESERPALTWRGVRLNVLLFVLTVVSLFWTGMEPGQGFLSGAPYAVPLLAILLAHEFGHYFAARYHGVPASLPYFIPLPKMGFGTLGAVIAMRDRIRSRNALLDVGASGPLAGMVIAIPVLIVGLTHSPVSVSVPPYEQEGQSLLYLALKWLVLPPIPPGSDVQLNLTAQAGWVGLFLTMINLLPFGQLDGGHVAYALLGERQNRIGPWIRRATLPLLALNLAWFVLPALSHPSTMGIVTAVSNSLFWLVWFGVLGLLQRFSGKGHPPCEPGELGTARKIIGWVCVVLFVVLFMPTPLSHVN